MQTARIPSTLGPRLLLALLVLAAGAKAILFDTLDPDSFWHLRVADQLTREGVGPIVDGLSYSSVRAPWTPYSWLAELMMKAVWDFGGYRLAILIQSLTIAGIMFFVAMSCNEVSRRSERQPRHLGIALCTALGGYLSLPFLSFRPVTFVILILACCAWLIFRDRRLDERSKCVWWIVPLTIVGTNMHFFIALIPLWVGLMCVGAGVEFWFSRTSDSRRKFVRLTRLSLATIAACLCTPMLPGVVRTILHYGTADPTLSAGFISEFQPIWAGSGWIGWAIVLAFVYGCCWRAGKAVRIGEWLCLIASTLLLLRMSRFAPVFALVACPLLAGSLPALAGRALGRRPVMGCVATLILVGIVQLIVNFPRADVRLSTWLNRNGPDTPGYPCAAADFVAERVVPNSGRIINEFTWGGYLAWRLGDRYQVFVDGRTQLYSAEFWKRAYLCPAEASIDVLSAARADAAIVPAERSRFKDDLLAMGWTIAHRDERALVLLPPDVTNANASGD